LELSVSVPHLPVDLEFFSHENGQLGPIAAPFGLGNVRSHPAL
jgi:hypothetical protein